MNVEKIWEGYKSVPKGYEFKSSGFEILMWDSSGTIQSPGFGEQFDRDRFKMDMNLHYVLKFPPDLAEVVGGGSLVVELEVDTFEVEGWQEEVE